MKFTHLLPALAGLGALALAHPALADTTHAFTFVGISPDAQVVNLSTDGGVNFENVYAGRYLAQLDGGAQFNIFCVDATHDIHTGDQYAANTDYLLTDAAGSQVGSYYHGGLASALIAGNFLPSGSSLTGAEKQQRADAMAYLADSYLNASSFSNASGSADVSKNEVAINLADWDIIQDGGNGLTAGNLRVGSDTLTTYGSLVTYYENQAITAAQGGYTSQTARWIQAPLNRDGGHKQVYVAEMPVPEPGMPATMSCLALVVGVAFARRRRSAARPA